MCNSQPSLPTNLFPPKEICILGAGHFGYIAAERLSRRYPEAGFLVVDADEENLKRIREDFGLPIRVQEATSFMSSEVLPDSTWIVPAVPIHMALEWIKIELNRTMRALSMPVPETVDLQVPNPYRSQDGTLYASYATFICPDTCNEPDNICTHTGMPRIGNLFEEMGRIKVSGYDVVVIRSVQLAPGVGGYPMSQLRDVRSRLSKKPGRYLIGTSCRCHGVIDALELNA